MHASDQLVFLDEPFTKEPLAWAIRKNDPDFLEWLNTFLDVIKKDGRFEKMRTKWFENTDWFQYVR
jgi:polar amino acid transport system substrate-binding protein